MRTCYSCGGEVSADRKINREDACEQCDQDLHCCRNCRFYDPSRSNQCAEPQAEWTSDKERGNFCELFEFRQGAAQGPAAGSEAGRARDQWRKLFN